MREFHQKTLSGLNCVVREKQGNQKAIILLHGYGADFTDLSSLALELDPEQNWDWYFPNGIIAVPIGPHVEGRAWFPIDMLAMQMNLLKGLRHPFAAEVPVGLTQSSQLIQTLTQSLSARYADIVLGGFSQGAMVSCDAALHLSPSPIALIQLSGNLVAGPRWEPLLAKKHDIKVFQSHGQNDPILPFPGAEELVRLFGLHHYPIEFVPFAGGHEISRGVLQRLQKFLKQLPTKDLTAPSTPDARQTEGGSEPLS